MAKLERRGPKGVDELCLLAADWYLVSENLRGTLFLLERFDVEAEGLCQDKRLTPAQRRVEKDLLNEDIERQCRSVKLIEDDLDAILKKAEKMLKTKDRGEIDKRLRDMLPECGQRGYLPYWVPQELWRKKGEKFEVVLPY